MFIKVALKYLEGLVCFFNYFRNNQIELCIDPAKKLTRKPELSRKLDIDIKTNFYESVNAAASDT